MRDHSKCDARFLMLALGLSNLGADIQSRKPGLKGLGVATQPFLFAPDQRHAALAAKGRFRQSFMLIEVLLATAVEAR